MTQMIVSDPPYGSTRLKWDSAKSAVDVLKQWEPNVGGMILCCNHLLLADLIKNLSLPFHDLVVWNKTPTRTWVSWSKPLRSMELVSFWGPSKCFDFRKTLEPQAPYSPERQARNRHFSTTPRKTTKASFPMWEQVWPIPAVRKKSHPTQKPLDLMVRLVRIAAFAGATRIIDPFEGSGTTGEACRIVGIPYQGSDSGEWQAA